MRRASCAARISSLAPVSSALGRSRQDTVRFQSFQAGSWFFCFLYNLFISMVTILSREVTSVS